MDTPRPVVAVVAQDRYDVEEIRSAARLLLEGLGPRVRGMTVFVKPSFVYPARPPHNRGVNTQPELVGGVVRALADLGASRVWVGEDCLVGPAQSGFLAMGVLPFLRGYAEPVFFSDEPRVRVTVENPFIEGSFLLPRRLVEADLFLSLPKLKVNMYAGITLSAKNSIGLLPLRDRLPHHDMNLHLKIADIYRARRPDFVLTDAIVAGEGQGPMHPSDAALGCIVAGANGVAVDVVCCALAGYEPASVPHLKLLADRGEGPLDRGAITIRGEEVLDRRRRALARPRMDFLDCRGVTVLAGADVACHEGCLGMVRGSLDRFARDGSWGKIAGFSFIVGKPVRNIPAGLRRRRTIVVGDCAREHRGRGRFIAGCPVPPMSITYALTAKGAWRPLEARLRDLAFGAVARFFRIPLR